MKLSDFQFELPQSLLAQRPAPDRDESRLMVLDRKNESIEHHTFKEVLNFFEEGDVMVLNNTKVFPARLFGNKEKTGARIEVFLLRELNEEQRLWDVLVDPARKIRIGNKLYFGEDDSLVAEVIDNTTSRGRTLRFLFDGSYSEFRKKLKELGQTPLPKYIKRPLEEDDQERYQTIYAKHEGAVAAPTAGLHFTDGLISKLKNKGVKIETVTLHIGLGTFRPVQVEDLNRHQMDSEYFEVSTDTSMAINQARKRHRKIVAVGTSTVRALETIAISGFQVTPKRGWTDKFIYPPYEYKMVDRVITNFHSPQSTLLMMVSAFAGRKLIKKAYLEAKKNDYRFLSYGDAMIII